MFLSSDMIELLRLFESHAVRYLLVGGYAVNYYGYLRLTQDIDFLVMPSEENAKKIMQVLEEFGFGGAGIQEEYFRREGTAVHLGVEPNRIDLLTGLKGIPNSRLFEQGRRAVIGGVELDIIDFEDLLQVKRKSNRARDRADAEELERIHRR